MAPQPLLDVLSRTPLRAPPNPATRQGHGDWLAAAQHRSNVAKRRAVWNPLHPRRSSACAQGMAGHGRPAKACHDTDVVSGRPRAQALRRAPAQKGRRGCGVPSLWFLSLGKQRKEPAPFAEISTKRFESWVRNHEHIWSFSHPPKPACSGIPDLHVNQMRRRTYAMETSCLDCFLVRRPSKCLKPSWH